MIERIDSFSKTVAMGATRRRALLGLGALALGSIGVLGAGQTTEAENNDCQRCRRQCKRNNKKKGKKDPNNCHSRCSNRCRNN